MSLFDDFEKGSDYEGESKQEEPVKQSKSSSSKKQKEEPVKQSKSSKKDKHKKKVIRDDDEEEETPAPPPPPAPVEDDEETDGQAENNHEEEEEQEESHEQEEEEEKDEEEEDALEAHNNYMDKKSKSIAEIKKDSKSKSKPPANQTNFTVLDPLCNFDSLPTVNVPTEVGPLTLRYFCINDEFYYLMKDIYEKSTLESSQSIIQKKAKQGSLDKTKIFDGKDYHWVSTPKKIAAAISGSTKMATRIDLLKFFAEKHIECKEYYNPTQKKRKKAPESSNDNKDASTSEEAAPKKRKEKPTLNINLTNEESSALTFALNSINSIREELCVLNASYLTNLKHSTEMGQKVSAMKLILESALHRTC